MSELWQLLNAPQTAPFGIALMIMLLLFIIEAIELVFGSGNDWLDGLLPDELNPHAEVGVDMADAGIAIRFLSWLYVGKVPVLMLLVLFLTIFGLLGFFIQNLMVSIIGFYLPSLLAVIVVWFLSLPILRVTAKGVHKILPKDETTAINQSELIGRVGVITIGTASTDKKAEVKVKDTHNQTHYVMVFSDNDEILNQGDFVLLVSYDGVNFRGIKNTNESLINF